MGYSRGWYRAAERPTVVQFTSKKHILCLAVHMLCLQADAHRSAVTFRRGFKGISFIAFYSQDDVHTGQCRRAKMKKERGIASMFYGWNRGGGTEIALLAVPSVDLQR